MRVLVFVFILMMVSASARDGYGYALFGIGNQSANYIEEFRSDDGEEISMRGTVVSPYYYTGTGVKFNEYIDFSLAGSSTLYANTTDEAELKFPTSTVLHSMDLRNNDLMFYTHYKYTKKQHFLFGTGYSNETIKRFLFQENIVNTHAILETNTLSANLEIGYVYSKDEKIGHSAWNYSFGLMLGMPIFTSVIQIYSENLDEEKKRLDFTYGLSLKPTLFIERRIFEGFDIALSLDYYYRIRFENSSLIHNSTSYTSQKSILNRYRAGIFAIWNFDSGAKK